MASTADHDEASQAVQHFIGANGIDLREYGSWYDDTTLEYLARTLKESQHHALRVIFFHDPKNENMRFVNQARQLQLLKNSLDKKGALFICHEPVVGHHYLFGILYGNRLLLVNPVGASDHEDLYEALAAVKEQGIVEEVYLSRTRIQEEEHLVSCGPISVELLLYYGGLEAEDLEEVIGKICSVDAFFDAIRDNDAARVIELSQQDSSLLAKIVARDNGQGAMREWTPLMYAAQEGHLEVVEYLLGEGALVNQAAEDGFTPFMIAAPAGPSGGGGVLGGSRGRGQPGSQRWLYPVHNRCPSMAIRRWLSTWWGIEPWSTRQPKMTRPRL